MELIIEKEKIKTRVNGKVIFSEINFLALTRDKAKIPKIPVELPATVTSGNRTKNGTIIKIDKKYVIINFLKLIFTSIANAVTKIRPRIFSIRCI